MAGKTVLSVNGLSVMVEDTQVLKKVSLVIEEGQLHALMGPNGSGKSSLAMTLLGSPRYQVLEGKVQLEGVELLPMTTDERARKGLYVAWQNPMTVPGVKVFTFCKAVYEAQGRHVGSVTEFKERLEQLLERVGLSADYLKRGLNEGFSGGEKKRIELLLLLLIQPKLAVMDEIDSGLDIDALKLVTQITKEMAAQGTAFLLITHYKRLLEYVKPTHVHVMKGGEIRKQGGQELVEELELEGYGKL